METGVDHLFPSSAYHLQQWNRAYPDADNSIFAHQVDPPTLSHHPLPPQQLPPHPVDDEPLYVNAKQYYRILKRRVARARLEELHRLSRQRKVLPFSPCLLFSPCRLSHISTNPAISMLCAAHAAQVADFLLQTRLRLRKPPKTTNPRLPLLIPLTQTMQTRVLPSRHFLQMENRLFPNLQNPWP